MKRILIALLFPALLAVGPPAQAKKGGLRAPQKAIDLFWWLRIRHTKKTPTITAQDQELVDYLNHLLVGP